MRGDKWLLMKYCCYCKDEKYLEDFHKSSSRLDGLQNACKECRKISNKEYRERNKQCIQVYRDDNREKANAASKKWIALNPERRRETRRKWCKKKYHMDPVFKLEKLLRSRINNHLQSVKKLNKSSEPKKIGSPVRDLGCSVDTLISHLEKKFAPGMTWANHGTRWQIDHIQPLAGFDITDRKQFLEACHYTNMQPLWIEEHRKKTKLEGKRLWPN